MRLTARRVLVWLGMLAGLLLALVPLRTGATRAQETVRRYENFDVRTSKVAPAQDVRSFARQAMGGLRSERLRLRSEAREAALQRMESRLGWRVERSRELGSPEIVRGALGRRRLSGAAPLGGREATLRRFLASNQEAYGLDPGQVADLRTAGNYLNPARNMAWVSLEQKANDLAVFQGEVHGAFSADGTLVQTTGLLAPDLDAKELARDPAVGAEAAVRAAAASIGVDLAAGDLVLEESTPTTAVFAAGPFADQVKAQLVYFPLEAGVAHLAWSMTLWQEHVAYSALVDAEAGALLFRKNITNEQTAPATYSIYNDDSPAPLSPSNATPGSGIQGAAIPRTTLTLISELPAFDDLGWIPDGANTTSGNNVDAGLDIASPDGIDPAGRPVPAVFRVFDFPYNPAPGLPGPGDAPTGANYRAGAVTNLFFWSNRYHDRLYELGFTEAARNFQQNNFGRGGLGNDRVLAQVQDFSGTNNANFATPADGTSGRMQMFIFTGPNPDRDGDLDADIFIHELTHGTSNRLHNNGSGLATSQAGGMGEGWSDFYARALLSTADEDVAGLYPAGGYSTLNIGTPPFSVGTDNYYYGIRRFPYALKTTVGANGKPHNPLTFADIDPAQIDTTDGAFPESPLDFSGNGANEVHNIGEVWAMALLEVRARLIGAHGFASGNQRALQIVTDGMKLDPINPNLLQARNSILTADLAGFLGADELDIWRGFATRGMGFSATVNAGTSVTEAFDIPNLTVGPVTVSSDSCDFGGHADPGETVTLSVPLTNPFLATTATGVTASLGGSAADYGDIAPGATVSRDFVVTIPSSQACGSQLPNDVSIDSSLGPVVRTFTLQIGLPTGTLPAVTYGSGNIAVPIPDVATVEIPIDVPDEGAIADVNVRVRLNHTFDGDLVLQLVAPDGTVVNLANNRGGAGDNYGAGANDCSGTPAVFDDAAGTAISAGIAPFAGSFRPETPLSALNGKSFHGTWKLRVRDTAALDVGTVGCVQLEIVQQLYFCCGVPGTPIVAAAPPAVVTAESVAPGNGAPDPDETVTMSFPLRNVGTGITGDLVATLLPGGGVNAPSGPRSYGSFSPADPPVAREFTFVASGTCGGFITATFHLQDGLADLGTVTFSIRLGTLAVSSASFANPGAVAILDTPRIGGIAPGSPYPSNIAVSGITGTVTKVTATLRNMSHTFPGDIDILLVGPGGQKMILMSDAGGSDDINNVTLTFDDAAAAALPSSLIVSGTFRPTNSGTGDTFPAPAPAGPYGAALSAFNGVSPNGTWSLYVVDDAGIDAGNIAGGWSLTITTADPVCEFEACTLACPADVVEPNQPAVCGALVSYGDAAVSGSCGTVATAPPSPSFFPVGTSPVTSTATRQDGATTSCSFDVTVNDVEKPAITAPPPVTVSTGGGATACAAVVSDALLGTPTGSDNCPTLTFSRSGVPAGNLFPVGTTLVTYTATDGSGNASSASQAVTVLDTTPPVLSAATANPSMLWPPNHKWVLVTVGYTTSDLCGAVTTSLSVASNEPIDGTGDGDTSPDWEIVDNHHVRLRAERAGGGSGRVYTITVTAADGSGNTSQRTVAVTVPHNR
jgi:subtilisin-like proprotein convertase family protein